MAGQNGGSGAGASGIPAAAIPLAPLPPQLLGTVLRYKESSITLTTTPQQVCAADATRVMLLFVLDGTNNVVLSTNPKSGNVGLLLIGQGAILTLNVNQHGTLPQQAWYGNTTAVTSVVAFYEMFYQMPLGG